MQNFNVKILMLINPQMPAFINFPIFLIVRNVPNNLFLKAFINFTDFWFLDVEMRQIQS
jgi:hypothetical protein